jgi:hypothetical protein
MPPDLVVANASFTVYPGGLVVLRATDWLAAARGTLSTENDSRAITGQAVRDTQQVTNSLFSNEVAAFQEAEDTLEIDLSSLPLQLGMTYFVWFSVLIEGDWDPAGEDGRRGATNLEHAFGCNLGWYGDSVFYLSDSDFASIAHKPRSRGHYAIHQAGELGDVEGDEVLHVRAYAFDSTTIEWLVDQIFIVPRVVSGVKAGEWRASDFAVVGGQHQTFGAEELVDGADSGDDQGKFTWHPYSDETEVTSSANDGGGDYQRKSDYTDAEYMIRVVPDDFYILENSETSEEVPADGYSVHGANYRHSAVIISDDFSRTTSAPSGGWGVGPEGFGYWNPSASSSVVYVNGSQGVIENGATVGSAWTALRSFTGGLLGPNAASTRERSLNISGIVSIESPTLGGPSPPTDEAFVRILLNSIPADRSWFIHFNTITKVWALYLGNNRNHFTSVLSGGGVSNYKFSSDFDISSWFVFDDPVGFRILKERYRLRVRIWDATGAEPSSWDFDGFIPITTNLSGNLTSDIKDYPYSDNFFWAHNSVALGDIFPSMGIGFSDVSTGWTTLWDDLEISYDPLGDPDSMFAAIEQPEDTKIGEIEVPFGAYQMIYWGRRDWTTLDAGTPYLEFSARVWNNTAAGELQRAEAPLWYFRSVHGNFTLVVMNWRSSDRQGSARRVLLA